MFHGPGALETVKKLSRGHQSSFHSLVLRKKNIHSFINGTIIKSLQHFPSLELLSCLSLFYLVNFWWKCSAPPASSPSRVYLIKKWMHVEEETEQTISFFSPSCQYIKESQLSLVITCWEEGILGSQQRTEWRIRNICVILLWWWNHSRQ